MALKHVNAVVVGSGAGGGVAAKVLSEAGLSVVVLERGSWVHNRDHFDDDMLGWTTQILGPDRRHVRVARKNGKWTTIYPEDRFYCNNAAAVGGGTVFYGGMAWRFPPQDFRLKTVYGTVPDSSLEDWPIQYEDLEACYEKVEWEIGVAGDMSGCPQAPSRRKDYPMPAFPLCHSSEIIAKGAKRLGLHPFPVPYLRNSIRYNDRPACQLRRLCAGYNCPINARNGSHNTVLRTALATGLCDLRTECMAAEVVVNDRRQATGVRYFDDRGQEQFQPADIVVLSAGAVETARLLLNSKSRLFPDGAGNNQGWVGHNLHGHRYRGVQGLFEKRVRSGHSPEATLGILDYAHDNPGLVGGGLIDAPRGGQSPLRYVRNCPGWGEDFKQRLREFNWWCGLLTCTLDLPVFESKVTIDPKVKDAWGIPVLRVSAMRHPNDLRVQNYLLDKSADILRASGAIKVNYRKEKIPDRPVPLQRPHGQHQAGTCRMGNDPQTSVTNRYGQLHEIDNIFCADASLHVTSACLNPAETIMALGYWVSEYIAREWKGTGFRGN